jgi:hypothetical protein
LNDEQQLLVQLQQLGISQSDLAMFEMLTVGLLAATVIALVLTPWLARRKRLHVGFWTLMALLFGPFALLAIVFVAAKPLAGERLQ